MLKLVEGGEIDEPSDKVLTIVKKSLQVSFDFTFFE
jgi:hypothetical protein